MSCLEHLRCVETELLAKMEATPEYLALQAIKQAIAVLDAAAAGAGGFVNYGKPDFAAV